MMLLNTSLLRERFTITDKDETHKPIHAVGNRILLPLTSIDGKRSERLVIRTHSMHMALMMASRITNIFFQKDSIINGISQSEWKDIWYDVSSDFERPHTEKTWISIYHKGRPLYQDGEHHPFLDIIEQCDIKNRQEYDKAIPLAVDIFKQAGRDVTIEHDVNIAAVIGVTEHKTRCGLILRSPSHTSTFNFSLEENIEKEFKPAAHHGLELSALYLEAIQLSVSANYKRSNSKKNTDTINLQSLYHRIGRLNKEIDSFEKFYNVRYRPEKPNLNKLMKK